MLEFGPNLPQRYFSRRTPQRIGGAYPRLSRDLLEGLERAIDRLISGWKASVRKRRVRHEA